MHGGVSTEADRNIEMAAHLAGRGFGRFCPFCPGMA